MLPKWHILYGYIFSLVLVYFFNFSLFAGFITFMASVFIDMDHVLLYFLKTKNLNPWKFYSWSLKRKDHYIKLNFSERKQLKAPHFIFHGIEFVILISFLSFLHPFFFWILLGILLHLILDFLALISEKEHLAIKLSQIWLWQRNKNRKEF